MKRHALFASSVVILAVSSGMLVAGPLTPPAGPVTGTYKTLSEVEPRVALSATNTPGGQSAVYRIETPGSYYLTGNIQASAGQVGIELWTGNVTIDLNGYSIVGGQHGVSTVVGSSSVTIRNGTLQGATGSGVNLGSGGYNNVILEDLKVRSTGGSGIRAGSVSAVRRCQVDQAGAMGIYVGQASLVEDCQVNLTVGSGIRAEYGSRVRSCVVRSATADGFYADSPDVVFEGCNAEFCGTGFRSFAATAYERCQAAQGTGIGFSVAAGSTLTECRAGQNAMQGFVSSSRCVLTRCRAESNGGGQAITGFWVTGSGSRVEDCTATNNGYGFYVEGSDNFVARCASRGNSSGNFSVSGAQEVAPIMLNPGSTNFAGANPWSNFSY